MEGWIKIHRQILKWEWYKNEKVSRVFLHLLLCAAFQPTRFEGLEIQAGQYITTLKRLSEETGLTIGAIRCAMKKLTDSGEISVKTTNKLSLITVVKYRDYQDTDTENNKRTTNEQQTNDKPTTNEQQTNDTLNNNYNNYNNINNYKTEKKEENDIFEFEGVNYVYSPSFDSEGLEDEITELSSFIFYRLYVEGIMQIGMNSFNKKALYRKPDVIRALIRRGFFVPLTG